jgi:hypothetical protein
MPEIWRSEVRRTDHPDNGRGKGGCKVSSVFIHLDCGHTKVYGRSSAPSGRGKIRCPDCEKQTPTDRIGGNLHDVTKSTAEKIVRLLDGNLDMALAELQLCPGGPMMAAAIGIVLALDTTIMPSEARGFALRLAREATEEYKRRMSEPDPKPKRKNGSKMGSETLGSRVSRKVGVRTIRER